jgi:hypothetical protein
MAVRSIAIPASRMAADLHWATGALALAGDCKTGNGGSADTRKDRLDPRNPATVKLHTKAMIFSIASPEAVMRRYRGPITRQARKINV